MEQRNGGNPDVDTFKYRLDKMLINVQQGTI